MSRRGSDLYQVDFMAALFGGFVLVWLTGLGLGETAGAGDATPAFFVITARLYYGADEFWQPVLPTAAVETDCLPPDWLARLDKPGTVLGPCRGATQERTDTDLVLDAAWLATEETGLSQPRTMVYAFGVDLVTRNPNADDRLNTQIIGRAVMLAPHGLALEKLEVIGGQSHYATNMVESAVGVLAPGGRFPPPLEISHAAHIGAAAIDQAPGSPGTMAVRYRPMSVEFLDGGKKATHARVYVREFRNGRPGRCVVADTTDVTSMHLLLDFRPCSE